MAKYIKLNDVIQILASVIAGEEGFSLDCVNDNMRNSFMESARESCQNVPSIDIVRCKDCEYMKPKKDPLGYLIATCEYTSWNTIHGKGFENCGAVTADDYCSYGERKDDNN